MPGSNPVRGRTNCQWNELAPVKRMRIDPLAVEVPSGVKIALVGILLRYDDRRERPADGEARVIPAHHPLELRGISSRDEIQRFGFLCKRQNPVREAAGYIHHAPVIAAELGAKALAEAGGGRAQVRITSHNAPRTQRTILTSAASPSW